MGKPAPLKRKPVSEDDDESRFLSRVLCNFLIVNGLVLLGAIAVPNFKTCRGSTASSHLDPRTGRPILMQLVGCRIVTPDETHQEEARSLRTEDAGTTQVAVARPESGLGDGQ